MIITEKEKSKVVLSSLLERHYPELKLELWDIIGTYHKGMGTVSHTKDYWVRDFMPIQMDEYVFVKFVYNPDYLQDKKKYITNVDKVIEVIELELSKYDDLSWAYINSLQTCDFIIIPGLGDEVTDAETLAQYKQLYPEYEDNIYQVQMRDFIAENGGALNCLTWTIYENFLKVLAKCARIPIIDLEDYKKDQIKNKIDDMLKTKCKR